LVVLWCGVGITLLSLLSMFYGGYKCFEYWNEVRRFWFVPMLLGGALGVWYGQILIFAGYYSV